VRQPTTDRCLSSLSRTSPGSLSPQAPGATGDRRGVGMRIAAVPPIRYLRTDSTGTAIVGLPPLRITQECASCHAWLDLSAYRTLAAACRSCEAVEVAGRIQPTASRQAGGGPADTSRSRAVQKPSSGRPIACAGEPPRLPALNPASKAPQGEKRDKLSDSGGRNSQFIGPDSLRLDSTPPAADTRKQENDDHDAD